MRLYEDPKLAEILGVPAGLAVEERAAAVGDVIAPVVAKLDNAGLERLIGALDAILRDRMRLEARSVVTA